MKGCLIVILVGLLLVIGLAPLLKGWITWLPTFGETGELLKINFPQEKIMEVMAPISWIIKRWKLILVLVYVVLSLKIVGPDEVAGLIILGIPLVVYNSGPCLVPFLLSTLKRYPTAKFSFPFVVTDAISSEGEHKGKVYGSVIIKFWMTGFLSFPRNKKLKKIIKFKIPTDHDELKDLVEEPFIGPARGLMGEKTWKELTENKNKLSPELSQIIGKGVLSDIGFEDISISLTQIKIPDGLESALMRREESRVDAEGAKFEGEAIGEEIGGGVLGSLTKSGLTPDEAAAVVKGEKNIQLQIATKTLEAAVAGKKMKEGAEYKEHRVDFPQGPQGGVDLVSAIVAFLLSKVGGQGQAPGGGQTSQGTSGGGSSGGSSENRPKFLDVEKRKKLLERRGRQKKGETGDDERTIIEEEEEI